MGGIKDKKSNGGTQYYLQNRIYKTDVALAICTCCNPYYLVEDMEAKIKVIGNYMPSGHEAGRILDSGGLAVTVKENHSTVQATMTNNLRIRKLTPKECFRLMGLKDEDIDRVSKDRTDQNLYHLAGDSIVVNVLMAIFKELL